MGTYTKDELLRAGGQRVYSGRNLEQISFPLGGIGTGSVGLSGYGGLRDWEIFNRPNVGSVLPFTFPVIYAREQGGEPMCRVAQGPVPPPHIGSGGGDPCVNGEGFPHMDACTFMGEYPFARIEFQSARLPLALQLEAYNPYIPSSPDDSGFPAAILKYTLTNRAQKSVAATIAWSLFNPIGSIGVAEQAPGAAELEFGLGGNVNRFVERNGLRGLLFSSRKWKKAHPRFGTMALTTPEKQVTVMTYWSREPWFAPRHEFWDVFSKTGLLPDHAYGPSPEGQGAAGALGIRMTLRPRASRTVTFYVAWHFPNFEKYWHRPGSCGASCCGPAKGPAAKPVWRNHYAGRFQDAWDVAAKLHAREKDLYAETKAFHGALFSSTLPPYVLDAVSSQMAILKTATCLRLPDGVFYGFEGCNPGSGCCEGSCTHVWNYQQALPFLFPGLERSMRAADYAYNMRKDGSMGFRANLPLGSPPNDFLPCADGQMGGILKAYRDWKICGDDAWLLHLWPRMKQALEFAWKEWDCDKRGVMAGIQHNTYDIEFHGPNPLTGCFYLGALLAASEIAAHFGEADKAEEYLSLFENGRAWLEAHLYNGEYYVQDYNPKEAPRYQFGTGCLSDQMLGQWLASLAGLGHVLEPRRVRRALRAIFKYNWRPDLREHANAQRVYALNDEAGLLLCSWPRGGRPAVPFPYSDEVWTGIEYQVASHCLMEGLIREGLTIVKAARDRHDGIKRNPWDEFECGHHYARAMSSYGLLTALSGFRFDQGAGILGFAPRIHPDDFRCFWALDRVWGTYEQKPRRAAIHVLHGAITLSRLDLPSFAGADAAALTLGKRTLTAPIDRYGSITLPHTLTLRAGTTLTIAT